MKSKSLMLKSAVTSGVLALLVSGAGFAATSVVDTTAADASMVAVTDDAELNEMLDANDVDHGANDDVDQGAEHNTDTGAEHDVDDHAMNDVEIDSDVQQSAAEAINAQQDAVEATQEHGTNQSGSDSGPNG